MRIKLMHGPKLLAEINTAQLVYLLWRIGIVSQVPHAGESVTTLCTTEEKPHSRVHVGEHVACCDEIPLPTPASMMHHPDALKQTDLPL